MNLSTIVVLAIVVVLFVLAVRSLMRGGGSDCASCGGDCASKNCGSCNVTDKLLADMERADQAARAAEAGNRG